MNHDLPDVQAGFRKGRGTRDQIANIDKSRKFQKNIYFCFTEYVKAFYFMDHNKLWKLIQEMGIPDHLTCLLSNLYAGQEATVRTGHGIMDWLKIGKGARFYEKEVCAVDSDTGAAGGLSGRKRRRGYL